MTPVRQPAKQRRTTWWLVVGGAAFVAVLSAAAVAVAVTRQPSTVDKPRVVVAKPSATPSGPRPELKPVSFW